MTIQERLRGEIAVAIEKVRAAAFTPRHTCEYCDHVCESPTIIHAWAGPFGADWEVHQAIKYVEEATEVGYSYGWFGAQLVVHHGDKSVRFDLPASSEAS